jgi:hypothetical protein
MNVKQLIAELELRGQVPSCKSKPALQLQLLAVTTRRESAQGRGLPE